MSDININVSATYKQEVIYKECLHNHAASLGLVANDGCYEFLKPNTNNTVDGDSQHEFLCAVCKCHRNFHRKEVIYTPIMQIHHHQQPNFPARRGGSPANVDVNNNNNIAGRRKRKKRTMFTAEQQSRMGIFAERLGWRPKRADKEEILNFCMQIGISRRMFIVWVNNNRRRMNQDQAAAAAVAV
ncbi:zinc-finger homeodomain protein 9-like [Prosopis cineraria]|uniref:zinc-finger homeodomain protein 9-like n=1 Tax=Prosopis cineraria TaxID=364024 RepID=UPI00240FEF23|nr:zinc-finger homeodomain protein 9-like [Prosopis cineraria]